MLTLVAVDDTETQSVITQSFALCYPGSELIVTASGADCVKLARRKSPDVIIVDVYLRDIDGFEVIRKIRAFSVTPVLMISYIKEESQIVKALELGADEYLLKPVHSLEMIAYIRKLLKKSTSAEKNLTHEK